MFNEMVAGSFKYNPELVFNVKVDQVYQWQILKNVQRFDICQP